MLKNRPLRVKLILNHLGLAGSMFAPGVGLVTGYFSPGSIGVEGKLPDASTGEPLMMFADCESDQRALINVAGYTWPGSARLNIKSIAQENARVISQHGALSLKRKFPIRFMAL